MKRRSIVLFAVLLLASACSHAIPVKGTFAPPPNIGRIPLQIGVYYSQEFRTYEHNGARMGDRWIFPLGPASVDLFDRALPILFERVLPVATRPPLAEGTPRPAAIIEPRIEDFDFSLPFLKTGTYTAEITYRMTLYAPNGETVASWAVKGIGIKSGEFGFEFSRWPGEAADLAMQDAARKLIEEFRDVPEVRRWLRQTGEPVTGSVLPRSTYQALGGIR
jgi:hypothetical protein